jgi:hypothetical protein
MTCPGSVTLSEGIVEPPSSYADEGTAAHFVASTCLSNGTNAAICVGMTVYLRQHNHTGEHFESFSDGHPESKVLNQFEVDDDMARYVQVYLDYVRDLVKSANGELFVEVSVPLSHMTGEEDAEGTSDAVIIAGDEIIVVDLKYGRGNEVSAEANEQLLMYASGAMQEFALAGDFKRVRLAISQPRITSAPSEWGCSVEELREFEAQVFNSPAVVSFGLPEAFELNPSEEACRWCKAKATCPALSQFVQDEMGADFETLLTSVPPETGRYDNSLLSTKMACLDLIEDWCKAIRSKVETELIAGNDVPGWKLVQGRKGARAWTNKEEAEAVLKAMRLKKDEMYDFSLISPTTAEKLEAITPKRWAALQTIIKQTEGKPSVAPVTDKRPAISVTPVADDFSALPAA